MQDFDLPLPPLPEPDEPYSPYYRADEMQAYAREAVRASRDSMRAAGWILVRADKAEKGLEPVRAFVDGLHQQKLPKKIFMESKYNGSQLMTYADDFAVQAIQQWITAHPPIQVEPVARVDVEMPSGLRWLHPRDPLPPHGTNLYAHPPTQAEKGLEPVAWRWKDPAHRNVYMWWDATENPPANAQPLYAHPPTQVAPDWYLFEFGDRSPIVSQNSQLVNDEGELWTGYKQRVTPLYAHPPTSEWNDAIEAAAILAQESEGKDQIHERILVLKREPR